MRYQFVSLMCSTNLWNKRKEIDSIWDTLNNANQTFSNNKRNSKLTTPTNSLVAFTNAFYQESLFIRIYAETIPARPNCSARNNNPEQLTKHVLQNWRVKNKSTTNHTDYWQQLNLEWYKWSKKKTRIEYTTFSSTSIYYIPSYLIILNRIINHLSTHPAIS